MPSLPWGMCSFSLTPLQSKFAASLFATTVLVLVLFFVSFPRSAYSFDGGSSVRLGIPLNGAFSPALDGGADYSSTGGEEGDGGGGGGGDGDGDGDGGSVYSWREEEEYQDKFQLEAFGLKTRDNIVRGLVNGVPGRYNMQYGDINYWVLESSELFSGDLNARARDELRRRDGDERENVKRQESPIEVYITFNTCLQPQPNAAVPDSQRPTSPPPALQLFLSNTSDNTTPGPVATTKSQITIPVVGGYGNLTINATGSIWIGVYAPQVDNANQWQGNWNYELVVSTAKPYHNYIEDQFLYLVDTDDSTALLVTGNMTTTASEDGGLDEDIDGDELLARPPPYTMYAQNIDVPSRFNGLERSYCAVTSLAQVHLGNLDVSVTKRGLGGLPKEQFHVKELNRSSTYMGFLARRGSNDSNVAHTSGTLWRAINITTKSDGNCQIIYNLPFCSEVAYAVPSNPTLFSMDQLTTFYDQNAVSLYKNFTYSLQLINCNASKSAVYSIARSCTDCDSAYKTWLCAVTIPRCMDWSSNLPYLAERASSELFYNGSTGALQPHPFTPALTPAQLEAYNAQVANETGSVSSRNPQIDAVVRPGPYKEIKPCLDLCWSLVQSCPSILGFACPQLMKWGGGESYGERQGGDVTCSYLGAVYFLSGARRIADEGGMLWGIVVVLWFLVWEGL